MWGWGWNAYAKVYLSRQSFKNLVVRKIEAYALRKGVVNDFQSPFHNRLDLSMSKNSPVTLIKGCIYAIYVWTTKAQECMI